MAGIYLHIPFCKQACHYCNFHFSTSAQSFDAMVDALCREAELRSTYLPEPVETIYFGGGTPSLLPAPAIDRLLAAVRSAFVISDNPEITLEANPDDITSSALQNWQQSGINRLSIGIQSFFEEDLLWMNRAHNAGQAARCIRLAQEQGFSNITADLIYGSPGLTDEKWEQNVKRMLDFGIPHLSCYAMTVEPGTALSHKIEKKRSEDVDPDQQARQFHLLLDWLEAAGFEQYEISNFARPGFRSRHNSSYWQGRPYIGLGPSAHSFNGRTRQWNVANNALYLQALTKGDIPFEIETLSQAQQFNEYVMTALRTSEGISLSRVSAKWNDYLPGLLRSARKYIDAGKIRADTQTLSLTTEGKFLADGIAADLFI